MQILKELGRRLIAPEARWRLDTRRNYAAVAYVSHSLSLPLYEVSEQDRIYLGKFYAEFPEAAAFITLRILHECMARNGYDKSKLELAAKQSYLVGVRLFGEDGQAALSDVYGMFSEAHEPQARAISDQVQILVHATLRDAPAIQKL